MQLSETIAINGRFLRSTRIDQDDRKEVLEGYVFTSSVREILANFARQQLDTGQGSYTWTGPYGSGKSSLALVLAALLGTDPVERDLAAGKTGGAFARKIRNSLPPKRDGWKCVSVVGRSEEPHEVIAAALKDAGLSARQRKLNTPDKVINYLQGLAAQNPESSGGLILFLDEMGKFLEAAAHTTGDAYFFQLLGEAASRSNGRLIVIGILHQSFQEYANKLARDIRDEWSKIQGRYIDIPVNVSGDEQVELIAKAIVREKNPVAAKKNARSAINLLINTRPSIGPALEEMLAKAWPLNPLVTLLLGPISRRSYGQNQRSIFSFLSSSEVFGFQDYLERTRDQNPKAYCLSNLWDYLEYNLQASIAVSLDSHHFTNARDAMSRWDSFEGSELGVELLKAITLIELTQKQTGLSATLSALAVATNVPIDTVKIAVDELIKASVVVFRKHRNIYTLFDGSDFDIELALDEAFREIFSADVSSISEALAVSRVMAKRHYHKTGAIRWCELKVIRESQVVDYINEFTPSSGCFGALILALNDKQSFQITESVGVSTNSNFAIARSEQSKNLVALAREHSALKFILSNNSEIQRDRIARREVNDRIEAISGRIEREVWALIEIADWKIGDVAPVRLRWADLTSHVSQMADRLFDKSPVLRNELLNRTKPSASANSALKRLLHAAVIQEGVEGLGFIKYPAEKALFVSLVEPNGLYKLDDGEWKFVSPSKSDPANLLPIWNSTKSYLIKHGKRNVQLTEIYDLWREKPFGLKDGLMPFLAVLFMMAERKNLSHYREGIFLSTISDVDVDYVLRAPQMVQLRWIEMSKVTKLLLSDLANVAGEITGKPVETLGALEVGRALISAYESAAPWVQRTARLSDHAKKVRALFKRSNDPSKFAFDDIPALYGEDIDVVSEDGIAEVAKNIKEGLTEIQEAYSNMLSKMKEQILDELQVHGRSGKAYEELNARAKNIKDVPGDLRLRSFINQLTVFDDSVESMESLAGLGINKPARAWIDNDIDCATVQLTLFAQQFNQHESVARVKGRTDKRAAMAFIVSVDGRPTPVVGEFDVMDTDFEKVDDLVDQFEKMISGSAEKVPKNIILAALAKVGAARINEQLDIKESDG